jgi:hypothetical protein
MSGRNGRFLLLALTAGSIGFFGLPQLATIHGQ